jgi:predicted RNA-binding Zn ribbon-like protein
VNTLDERPFETPIENLATYGDLVRFAELAKLIAPPLAARLRKLQGPFCEEVVRHTRRLREHLHDVLAAACSGRPLPRRDLDAITAAIRAARATRALGTSSSPALADACWSPPSAADIPLHACALAVERLLVEVDHAKIRKCAASDCGVYYVDTSKAHRRQWCSMRNCGNRAKQRRWRATAG